jgi:O-antigen/teichoic acid export membrane protein
MTPLQTPASAASQTAPLGPHVSRAMVWNGVLFPLKFAIALGSGIILVRLLNKHDYAVYSLVLWVAALIGTMVDLGMERSVGRFAPEVEARTGRAGLEKFFAVLFAVKLAAIAPVLIAFALAPDFFIHALALGDDGNILLWGIAALVLLGAVSDVFIQFLYTHFKQVATNLLDIVATLLQPLLILALVFAGFGVIGVVAAMVASSIGLDLLAGWRARGLVHEIPLRQGEPPPNLLRRFSQVAALNFIITATVSLTEPGFAALVLTGSHQLTAVAILAVGYRFVNYFLRFLVAPLTGIQTPLFARLYHEKRMDAVRESYSTLTKFFIFTLVPSAAAMILLSDRLIPFLFTTTYDASADVATVLVILLFAETITSIPLSMLIVFEAPRAVIWSRLLALLSVPLLLVLVPTWGALGAALAMGVPRVLSRVYSTVYTTRHFGIHFPFAFLFRVLAASTLAALPIFITHAWDWQFVAAALVAFVSIFFLLFKQFGGFDKQEKERLKTLRLPFRDVVLRWL